MNNTPPLSEAQTAAQFVNFTKRHVFLTGKAGTGKTTFLRSIVRETYKEAVIVAPTGIAAINAGGVTIHSLFQLPFGTYIPKIVPGTVLPPNLLYNSPSTLGRHLQMNRRKERLLRSLKLLIIDEVSMLRADTLDAIDFVLRSVRRNNQNFGGVQVLFIGDLYQLSPVVKREEWPLLSQFYASAFFFDALCLKDNPPVYVELSHIYRQSDPLFINLLNNLRNNCLTNADKELLETYYQPNFVPDKADNYITLTTHNRKADGINAEHLQQLTNKSYRYKAEIEKDFPENAYPVEFNLELKVGAQVMFIKNDLSLEKRYFNGKIAVVTRLGEDLIEVQLDGSRERIVLEKYTWENIRYTTHPQTNEVEAELLGIFRQYPIRLAWAITVHKSQGLTFDKAVVDIGQAFAPGQIYVALSRLRSLQGLVLTSYLNQQGLTVDQHVVFFARTKENQEDLKVQAARDTLTYLANNIRLGFDFELLDRTLYEHVFSYDKEENRSTKQQYLPWAEALYDAIRKAKVPADKFLKQLDSQFVLQQVNLNYLAERLEAASGYFTPILQEQRQSVLKQIEQVKQQNQVKEYLVELFDLEDSLYRQWADMVSAKMILQAHQASKTLRKEDLEALKNSRERQRELEQAFLLPDKKVLDKEEVLEKPKKMVKIKKEKAPKKERIDTKQVSLTMFEAGNSLIEIAKERKLTLNTIEGHLAHFVAKGELSAVKLIDKVKLRTICDQIIALKTIKSTEIKEALGDNFSYGEIRIALAHYLSEENREA